MDDPILMVFQVQIGRRANKCLKRRRQWLSLESTPEHLNTQMKRLRLAQSAEKIEHGGAGVEESKIANAKTGHGPWPPRLIDNFTVEAKRCSGTVMFS